MINKILMVMGLLSGLTPLSAQRFVQQAALPAIDTSRLYNIILTPEIIAGSTGLGLPDIRIYENGSEVPYLLQQESDDYDLSSFREFEILENTQVVNGISTLLFRNTGKLDHFELIVKNAWVTKQLSISGSNDRNKWYAVTEDLSLDLNTASPDKSGTTLTKTIQIPTTDYQYYRLLINDSAAAPLNIIKLGRYNIIPVEASYLSVPAPALIKLKEVSPRQTALKIQFSGAYIIRKLSFNISAPALYHRQATLCTASGNTYIPQQQFTLTSNQPVQVVLNNPVKEKNLYLFIDNENNPPLQIAAVKAWQANTYLISYLEKGKAYILKVGDTSLQTPTYDLSYFVDKLDHVSYLHAGKLVRASTPEQAPAIISTIFKSKIWIWAGIAGINLLIGFLVFKLIKDMQQQKR
jgi:hypothetical protein